MYTKHTVNKITNYYPIITSYYNNNNRSELFVFNTLLYL